MRLKDSKGVLSIEATISLTMLIFIVMLVLDIGFVYRAQNMVYHGMLQAAKTVSLFDYEVRKTETATETSLNAIKSFLDIIGVREATTKENLRNALKSGDAPTAAQIAFKDSVAIKQSEAKDVLLDYNVRKISFAESKFEEKNTTAITDENFVLIAEYEVELLVPVFGVDSITIKQSATSRRWG